jgi:cysteine desulfurase
MIYLDYNAITCGFQDIIKETTHLMLNHKFLNPSSIHSSGKFAKSILNDAITRICKSINAKCHDLYFVSGATEGNNMVLNSSEFDLIFTLNTEHDSILSPLKNKKYEFVKTCKDGVIDLNDLRSKLKLYNTSNFLCSVMSVNNESGLKQDINAIYEIVKEFGGVLHSDVSQMIGKESLNFNSFNADVITFSGNKIHSGFGGGCVIFTSGFDVKPLIVGGGQQKYKRGGTENIPQIFALSKAVELVNSPNYLKEYREKTLSFQNKIEDMVMQNGGDVFCINQKRVSNTSLIKMPNINNFVQMMEFDLNDISISIGSACSSGKTDISNVLKGVEMNEDDAKKYIRISTGIFNTDEEIEKFCEVWKSLLSR